MTKIRRPRMPGFKQTPRDKKAEAKRLTESVDIKTMSTRAILAHIYVRHQTGIYQSVSVVLVIALVVALLN